MIKLSPTDPKNFEAEVRNIARQLWPTQVYSGPITVDEKERDGIFVTEDVVHYVEITTARTERNTIDNLKKINDLLGKLEKKHPGKIAKGWYITLSELTGEQGRAFEQLAGKQVVHNTYHQFLARLIDSKGYISLRMKAPFGSARRIEDNSPHIRLDEYVPAELINVSDGHRIHYIRLRKHLSSGPRRILITGEFGVGKSMIARQIFLDAAQSHNDGKNLAFPVVINLRDHIEQKDPHECLHRHAKSIGFSNPEHLVRAWRAGYVLLVLDGFDELTPTISTKDLKRAKELRLSALELVRRFISETPTASTLVITGRSNFFDTNSDLVESLNISKNWDNYLIPDFSDQQVELYLEKKKYSKTLPAWLPKRPLLIGYLMQRKLLPDGDQEAESHDHVVGWNRLLQLIAEREVDQVYLALSPAELLQVYGRIATKCRKKINPRGPISLVECKDAFLEITGVEPEGRTLTALLRLPGLVGADIQEQQEGQPLQAGLRWFVDDNFLGAVASEDMLRAILEGHAFDVAIFKGVQHIIPDLGVELALSKLPNQEKISGMICASMLRVSHADPQNPLALDLMSAAVVDDDKYQAPVVLYKGLEAENLVLDMENIDLSNVSFKDCLFGRLILSSPHNNLFPRFDGCLILKVETHFTAAEISAQLRSCDVGEYVSTYSDYDQFKNSSSDDRLIVVASLLDKLFVQSPNGRRQSALRRGLSPRQLDYLEPSIEILRRAGYISKVRRRGETIWVPDMAFNTVARGILRNPEASQDPIILEVKEL